MTTVHAYETLVGMDKPRNDSLMRLFQELRKGSRAQPVPSKKKYKRKPKHTTPKNRDLDD